MPIRFRCQDCRSRVKVPEGSQGKQVRCPRCGRVQTVPKHSQHGNDPVADGRTVHTLVGSIHKAPKRKEALVGAGAGANGNGHDRYALSGGGVPGGLDLSNGDDWQTPHPDHRSMSRKERRRLRAEARRIEREQQAQSTKGHNGNQPDQDVVEDSRRRVAELFASSSHKTDKQRAEHSQQPVVDRPDSQSAPVTENKIKRPEPIAFSPGKPDVVQSTDVESTPKEHSADQINKSAEQQGRTSTSPVEHLTLDLTQEPYPFLRVIPWVLRVLALMLIGPAFKAMLVADAQGFSGVVCFLVLLMGLALVLVTWTVGEIATAVRDIALRKAAG